MDMIFNTYLSIIQPRVSFYFWTNIRWLDYLMPNFTVCDSQWRQDEILLRSECLNNLKKKYSFTLNTQVLWSLFRQTLNLEFVEQTVNLVSNPWNLGIFSQKISRATHLAFIEKVYVTKLTSVWIWKEKEVKANLFGRGLHFLQPFEHSGVPAGKSVVKSELFTDVQLP